MLKVIKCLESAEKVAAIQSFFGVTYHNKPNVIVKSRDDVAKEDCPVVLRKSSTTKSPDTLNRSADREQIDAESPMIDTNNLNNSKNHRMENTNENKNYRVKYKFWYYLFLFGTHLGDIVGYAVFLPFLFWNIDGVIARKLVLVWTAVMYIGTYLSVYYSTVPNLKFDSNLHFLTPQVKL